jgi:hypothetical protein
MTQQHPITPPPELVKQWMEEFTDPENAHWKEYEVGIATRAAQWGADTELEACCEWINSFQNRFVHAHDLRLVRRPPSLKEQALSELDSLENMGTCNADTIRRALESLPE